MSTHKWAVFSGMIPGMGLSIDKLLSENLKRLFAKKGITSAVKAQDALGVPRSTIDRALNARGSAKVETLEEIATGLKLEAWQLLVPDLDPDNLPTLAQPDGPFKSIGDVVIQAEYADLWKIGAGDMIRLISEFATSTSTGRAQILRMAESAEKIASTAAVSAPANES